jgi:hypothetical protein
MILEVCVFSTGSLGDLLGLFLGKVLKVKLLFNLLSKLSFCFVLPLFPAWNHRE